MATMEIQKVRETTAETAKRLRGTLKAAFPETKFSVRSRSYAGGSSIDIRWTDGPSTRQVDAVKYEFEGATFDGMIDLKSYKDPTLYAREDGTFVEVRAGADYVLTHRDISQQWREQVAAEVTALTGELCDLTSWGDIGPDGEQTKRNGAGWDRMFCALVMEEDCPACVHGTAADGTYCEVCHGAGRAKGTAKIVRAGECSKTSGRDIYYAATAVPRGC